MTSSLHRLGVQERSVGRLVSQHELILHVAAQKHNGQRVVFTSGCFDLLHPGHLRCLEQARARGDVLVVALHSDASVRQLKGDARPLLPQQERAEILAALAAVDYVVIFDAPTPLELIQVLRPHVLVKGGDWGPEEILGRQEVEAAGGQVISVPLEPGYSTTSLLQRISSPRRACEPRSGLRIP